MLAAPALATSRSAAAQSNVTGEAAALALRNRGLERLRAHDHAGAIAAFEQSLAVVESPNTRLDLGRALLAAGRVASAVRELERARDTARARVDAGQPHYLATARAAAAECDALRGRVPLVAVRFAQPPPAGSELILGDARIPAGALIAPVPVDPGVVTVRLVGPGVREVALERRVRDGERLTVEVPVEAVGRLRVAVRPLVAGLTVRLDGRALDAHDVGTEQLVAPGAHRVEASAPGFDPATIEREVAAGASATIELSLAPHGSGHASTAAVRAEAGPSVATSGRGAATSRAAAGAPAPRRTRGPAPLVVAGGVTAGLGVAAAVAGLVLWFVADGEYNALVQMCPAGPCADPALRARADTGQALETAGVVGLAAGGAIAVVGAVMLGVGLARGGEPRDSRPGVALLGDRLVVRF